MQFLKKIILWEKYFNTKDFKKFYNLYDKNMIFIPTFLPDEIIYENRNLYKYFEKPELLRTTVELNNSYMFTNNYRHLEITTGRYKFYTDNKNYICNYTFVYKDDKIVHHHSSRIK